MCKWCELIIALVILVFSFWQVAYSKWIIIITAIVLLIHSFMRCRFCCDHEDVGMKATKKKRL